MKTPTYTHIMRTTADGLFTSPFCFTDDEGSDEYLEIMNAQAAEDEIYWKAETGLPNCSTPK
jgi:hypothetical protein